MTYIGESQLSTYEDGSAGYCGGIYYSVASIVTYWSRATELIRGLDQPGILDALDSLSTAYFSPDNSDVDDGPDVDYTRPPNVDVEDNDEDDGVC